MVAKEEMPRAWPISWYRVPTSSMPSPVGRGDGMSGMLKFILPIRIWAGGFML